MAAFTLDTIALTEDFFGQPLGQVTLDFGKPVLKGPGGEIAAKFCDEAIAANPGPAS